MTDESDAIGQARRVCRLLRVAPGQVELNAVDPRGTPGLPAHHAGKRGWSRAEVARLGGLIAVRQERLYAAGVTGAGRSRVLLVLQAMDGGGKDGTVKSVLGAMNPLGVRITAFGPPSAEERAHHYLWRIDRALPPVGFVGVFNRSHYEDVLVARVRGLVPKRDWSRRYDEINAFEAALVADGLVIVKVMLHISPREQLARLLARLDEPAKRWKFDPGDVDERARWGAYQAAYADVLQRCTTPEAPWYVVPADRKWYRNWAVANILLAHLDEIQIAAPHPRFDVEEQRRRLLAGGPGGGPGDEVEHQVNNA